MHHDAEMPLINQIQIIIFQKDKTNTFEHFKETSMPSDEQKKQAAMCPIGQNYAPPPLRPSRNHGYRLD